jgi:hypothetical protein
LKSKKDRQAAMKRGQEGRRGWTGVVKRYIAIGGWRAIIANALTVN